VLFRSAFRKHAKNMRLVAVRLDKIADMIAGHDVKVRGDTHMIEIKCDEKLANDLIEAKLAYKPPTE